MGVRLVIDDFGKGYSSLSYLRRLPVDEIKIDRSFIIGLADGEDDTLVRCMIELAHNLGMTVVGRRRRDRGGAPAARRAQLRRGSGLLHLPACAGPAPSPSGSSGRQSAGPSWRATCSGLPSPELINYALTVMSFVHHAHHCHHHRSLNGPAGVCA